MSQKSARLEARLTPQHQSVIQHAATLRGQSLTDFVVNASVAAAKRAIFEHGVIMLSVEDQTRFAAALINPDPPNAALQDAATAHKELIEPA